MKEFNGDLAGQSVRFGHSMREMRDGVAQLMSIWHGVYCWIFNDAFKGEVCISEPPILPPCLEAVIAIFSNSN